MKKNKLNLGCGQNIQNKFPHPWLNVDIAGNCADIHCDIRKLPNEWTNKFIEVRVSHVLEHIFMDEFDSTMTEWLRVLKPGGTLRIIVPDLNIIIKALVSGTDSKGRQALSTTETTPILSQIFGFGYQSRETSSQWRHRFLFNKELLRELLRKYKNIGKISFYRKEKDPAVMFGIKDDSQNPFSLCMQVRKLLSKEIKNGNHKT